MMRWLICVFPLVAILCVAGCVAVQPPGGEVPPGGEEPGEEPGEEEVPEPLAVVGAVKDAQGAENPTFSFIGGSVIVSATLSGTVPENVTVKAVVTLPEAIAAPDASTVEVALAKGEGQTYSGIYQMGLNLEGSDLIYVFQVVAAPTEGDPVTADAGQATVRVAENRPPGRPSLS